MITKITDRFVWAKNSSEDNTNTQKKTVMANTGADKKPSFHGRIIRGVLPYNVIKRPGSPCRRISVYPESELSRFDVIKKASSKYKTLDRDMISEAWEKVVKR